MPGVCPHLVDRHYKSAKRRHSFEDISQSRGNVVRDNAPDIARRSAVCEFAVRARVLVRAATRGERCPQVTRGIRRSSTESPTTSRTFVLAMLLGEETRRGAVKYR